jgi:hypothetical protein
MAIRIVTDEQVRDAVDRGLRLTDMSKEFEMSKSGICERLQRLHLKTKPRLKKLWLKKPVHVVEKTLPRLEKGESQEQLNDLEFVNSPDFKVEGEFKNSFKKKLQFTEILDDGSVRINGVPFSLNPDIGVKSDPERKLIEYKFNYVRVAQLIASGVWPELETYRKLIGIDLFFLLFFIVKPFSDDATRAKANHPFVVQACREVEEGPKDFTLDLWARYHFKTSIVTIAETIQFQLLNPECTTGIFSHKSPIAKDFLFSIREIFQNEAILAATYPDVVWENCKREAPQWSLDEGIILKRKTNRKEASVSAHGLVEGMPTGLHFERRDYDDVSTNDIANSFDSIQKVQHAFDISQNLKTLTGSHHRVVGTYYSHNDPLIYIRDKKDLQGNSKYHLRVKPATHDGTASGKPVLMSQEALDELKGDSSFNAQQLLDPTPSSEQRLNPDFLQRAEPGSIPKNVYRFMLIDQAGDATSNKTQNTDAWAMGIFGVEPFSDEIGQSKIFLKDLWIEVCGESEAIERAVRMYTEAGIVSRIGVEKVGQTTTHIHIANALKARGRHIEFSDDRGSTGVLLRPAGRNKKKFIESALAWPLNNSKWFFSSEIPARYIDRLKQEMTNFPLWHDDALNICAYLYDVLRDYRFPPRMTAHEKMLRDLEQGEQDSGRSFPVPVI